MTKERNFANDELRPIQEWENDQVHGEAIACKKVYDVHLAKVTELRQRQEAYETSLPKDPIEAMAEINRTLKDTREFAEPQYAARAALEIIHQLATHGALEDSTQLKEAIYWLAGQRQINGRTSLIAIAKTLSRSLNTSRKRSATRTLRG